MADHQTTRLMGSVREFADLDGDGNLEIVLILPRKAVSAPTPFELRILSFANGETRWIHHLTRTPPRPLLSWSAIWTVTDARKLSSGNDRAS